jgi:hypothetical protein
MPYLIKTHMSNGRTKLMATMYTTNTIYVATLSGRQEAATTGLTPHECSRSVRTIDVNDKDLHATTHSPCCTIITTVFCYRLLECVRHSRQTSKPIKYLINLLYGPDTSILPELHV